MTVHTVTLEDQGKPSDRLTMQDARRGVHHGATHNRCQHEARTNRGIIRQCRMKSVTTVSGQRLCWRHAQP